MPQLLYNMGSKILMKIYSIIDGNISFDLGLGTKNKNIMNDSFHKA